MRRAGFALLAAAALGVGCATSTPRAENIAPAEISVARNHASNVSVHTRGGGKDWRISDEALRQAIETAVQRSHVFAAVGAEGATDYRLDVVIGKARYPVFGIALKVDLETLWQLQKVQGGDIVWQETIKASHTAAGSEAFAAVVRLRIAAEGAARTCVEQGIAKLSALDIP